MRAVKEGDKGRAWHPELGKLVEVVYQTRTIFLNVEDVEACTLVGVHLETDMVLMMPHQSSADVGRAIRAKEQAGKLELLASPPGQSWGEEN